MIEYMMIGTAVSTLTVVSHIMRPKGEPFTLGECLFAYLLFTFAWPAGLVITLRNGIQILDKRRG